MGHHNGYEMVELFDLSIKYRCKSYVWAWEESNLRPPNYQFGVLTTELHAPLPYQILSFVAYPYLHCNKRAHPNSGSIRHNAYHSLCSLKVGKNIIQNGEA